MTLKEEHTALHAAVAGPGELPKHLHDHMPATYWSAGYDTPIWKKLPLHDPQSVRTCLNGITLKAPMYISVSNVNRARFAPVTVDYAEAVDRIAKVTEPCVTLVDANHDVVALFPQEYHVHVLRGTVDDWPTVDRP